MIVTMSVVGKRPWKSSSQSTTFKTYW